MPILSRFSYRLTIMFSKRLYILSVLFLLIHTAVGQTQTTDPFFTRLREKEGPTATEFFGNSLYCDGATVVVSSPGKTVSALNNVGEVAVYNYSTDSYGVSLSYPFTPTGNEKFGYAIAPLNDITGDSQHEIIIGAPGSISGDGSVFLYDRVTSAPFATINSPATSGGFGLAVAEIGLVDLGGAASVQRTFIVGAPDRFGSDGAAYLYYYLSPNVITGRVLLGVANAKESLGYSFAPFQDLNGDGSPEIVIGAPTRLNGFSQNIGGITIYSPATDTVLARIDGSVAGLRFGQSLAAVADLSGDGVQDLLVSATALSPSGIGRVYLLSGATLASAAATVLCSVQGPTGSDKFGSSLVALGDLTADGLSEFSVGDPSFRETDPQNGSTVFGAGRLYTYSYNNVTGSCPLSEFIVGATPPVANLGFARDIARRNCDFDADGVTDLAVSTLSDAAGFDSGSVALYRGNPPPAPTPTPTPVVVVPTSADLSFTIPEQGTLHGRVNFDTAPDKDCSLRLQAKIVAGERSAAAREVLDLSPSLDGVVTTVPFRSEAMPKICKIDGITPALYMLSNLECTSSMSASVASNVFGRYLSCGLESQGLSMNEWLSLLIQNVSLNAQVRKKAKHRTQRIRTLIRKKNYRTKCR